MGKNYKGGSFVYRRPRYVKMGPLDQLINCEETNTMLAYNISPRIKVFITPSENGGSFIKLEPIIGKDYPLITRDGGIVSYTLKEAIAKGAYGGVYLLERSDIVSPLSSEVSDLPRYLSIKFPARPGALNNDLEIYKVVKDMNHYDTIIDSCHLQIRAPDVQGKIQVVDCLLMEKMDGPLGSFRLNNNETGLNIYDQYAIYFNILLQIGFAFSNLLDKGYYYTDCKVDNILYRILGRGQLEIFLADYGGACHYSKSEGTVTFPYIYRSSALGFLPSIADPIYGLFIIFLQLNRDFYYEKDINLLSHTYVLLEPSEKLTLIYRIVDTIVNTIGDQFIRAIVYRFTEFVTSGNLLAKDPVGTWSSLMAILNDSYYQLVERSQFGQYLVLPEPFHRTLKYSTKATSNESTLTDSASINTDSPSKMDVDN